MKKCTFLLLFILQFPLFGQWEIVNEGINGKIKEVDFVNADTGWAFGRVTLYGDVLYKTIDGGESWDSLPWDENIRIEKIDFINKDIGWLISCSGIFKSSDGGRTWYVQKTVADTVNLETLQAVNDSTVYVTGSYSKVFKTTDGGLNWTDISPDALPVSIFSSEFVDKNVAVISGDYNDSGKAKSAVIITFNGGITWDVKIIPEFSRIYELQFLNDSTCYFLARNNDEYFLCKTIDMFNNYTIIAQRNYEITSYFALDSLSLFALMDDSLFHNVMKTSDGGFIWENVKSEQYAILDKIYFPHKDEGFLFSNNTGQIIWKSTDGGDTWISKISSYPYSGVTFVDERTGFSSGGYHLFHGAFAGDVFKTIDAGKTWKRKLHTFGPAKTFFIDKHTGFSMDGNSRYTLESKIYKTTDAGNNWSTVYSNNEDSTRYFFHGGNDLSFLNKDIGWVVGRASWSDDSIGAGILGTNDGGENWDLIWKLQNNNSTYTLNSLYAIDTTAWAAGESGLIVKYNEADQWQKMPSPTTLPLRDVFFSDEDHGWIAGGYLSDQVLHSIFLRTTDAGKTWNEIQFDNYLINDVYFADSLHGWVVGEKTGHEGFVLKTNSGGENWTPVVKNLSGALNSIQFRDGIGWALGDNGLILRTDGLSWINHNTGEIYPIKISLAQNYPNPFNSISNFEFRISNFTHVNLSIYNILGQKVATLVNEKQMPGSYQVEWDASGFGSGVYIYTLETSTGFKKSRKLVLLK